MNRRLCLLCAAACLVAGTHLAHAATDVTGPQGLLKGQVPDNLPALKRVAIANFFVQYVTEFGIEMKSGNIVWTSKWDQPAPDQLTAGANALYAQLVSELKAAGVEVVDAEQVAAQPTLAEMKGFAKPSPAEVRDATLRKASLLVAARDLPVVMAPVPDQKVPTYFTKPLEGTPERTLVSWEPQSKEWLAGGNIEVGKLVPIYFGQAKIGQNLNATVLNVRLTIPLVDMGAGKTLGGLAGGGDIFESPKAQAVVKANPRFVESGTVIAFAQAGGNPGHRHAVALQKPVAINGLGLSIKVADIDPDKKSTARGGGLFGLIGQATGAGSTAADFLLSIKGEGFGEALATSATPIFKELAQILVNPK
jgi:hypothetical protein